MFFKMREREREREAKFLLKCSMYYSDLPYDGQYIKRSKMSTFLLTSAICFKGTSKN
jgi:hypothetical protein